MIVWIILIIIAVLLGIITSFLAVVMVQAFVPKTTPAPTIEMSAYLDTLMIETILSVALSLDTDTPKSTSPPDSVL